MDWELLACPVLALDSLLRKVAEAAEAVDGPFEEEGAFLPIRLMTSSRGLAR